MQLIARTGQPLAGSSIVGLALVGNQDSGLDRDCGGRRALNIRGQVAVRATLADGREGVFLWTPPGPRIRFNRVEGNDVVIGVSLSVPNADYQLRRRGALESGSWVDEGGAVAGTGSNIELRHVGGALFDGQLYRVELR